VLRLISLNTSLIKNLDMPDYLLASDKKSVLTVGIQEEFSECINSKR
jgi:hypothetical protein